MRVVIGIDEVGRGPVAGPVAVAAFMLTEKITAPKICGKAVPLRDSKKLPRVQREAWHAQVLVWQKEGLCDFAVAMISAKQIDQIGIAPAIRAALARCLYKLKTVDHSFPVLLDGGLRAPKEFLNQKTIIKGDEKEPAIALASIVAKVTRDRYMIKQAQKYPEYGFETHVGYGTKKHYAALKKNGMTPLHRKTFLSGLTKAGNTSR